MLKKRLQVQKCKRHDSKKRGLLSPLFFVKFLFYAIIKSCQTKTHQGRET
jgi:hypothetical protein